MRTIKKRPQEPRELLEYRKTPSISSSWDAVPGDCKEAIRRALIEDQGHLCCYCMRRVRRTDMKVEHWRSRRHHGSEELSWRNLFAACRGGEGGPRHQQTCDTRKGDGAITVSPLAEDLGRRVRYLADGRIGGDDDAINRDFDECLNLNAALCENRKRVLDGLQLDLKRRLGSGSWSKSKLEEVLTAYRSKSSLPEYLGVIEYWLEKMIRRR